MRNRRTYWTSTSPSVLANRGPGQRANPVGGHLSSKLQNPFVGRLGIDRLFARPPFVLQSFRPKVGKAMPPKADNPWLDPNFLGDRSGATPGCRQQNNPRPLQIALQCHRRASFEQLAIFPRKEDFSCFGYYPNVES